MEPAQRTGKNKDKAARCQACEAKVLDGKRLCQACSSLVAVPQSSKDLVSAIQQAVVQGIQQAGLSQKRCRSPSPLSDLSRLSPSMRSSLEGECFLDSNMEELPERDTLDPKSVDRLIGLIHWAVSPSSKYFAGPKMKQATFPLDKIVKYLIFDEWIKPEKGGTPKGKLSRLYPFSSLDSASWDSAPKVDAAVVGLGKCKVLLIDNVGSLRDPMDRRAERNLVKTYLAAGACMQPAVALSSVSRAAGV